MKTSTGEQTITIHGWVIRRGEVLGWTRLMLERGSMVLMLFDNPKSRSRSNVNEKQWNSVPRGEGSLDYLPKKL